MNRDRLTKARRSSPLAHRMGEGGRKPGEGRDRLSPQRRSWNMSRIRGKDTKPEKVVRALLHRLGYRFRSHVRIPVILSASTKFPRSRERERMSAGQVRVVGRKHTYAARRKVRCRTPRAVSVDFLLPKQRIAIFVHGCFWHRHRGCKNCPTPMHPYACVGCVS